jgi:putative modification enzyme of type III restriction-modification system
MTIWKHGDVGHSQGATQALAKMFDGKKYFDYPKPVDLIKRCISLYSSPDSLILDFFSGSATTAHAVMQLNAEDGSKRKYIMVQLPEVTPEGSEARKAGYNTICEIGKERIRRAGKKIKETVENKDKDLDIGFRVLRVDSSNMEDVYFEPAELRQDNLFTLMDSVKYDRTELDLLFGCMVDWGVELSYPLRKEEVAGKHLHIVNEGALVACFDKEINIEAIRHIAQMKPLRVIFRESCFATDADKLNIYEQFKQLCGWSDDEAYKRIHVI